MSNLADKLPEYSFTTKSSTNEVVIVRRFESGYSPYADGACKGEEIANEMNEAIGVTKAQAKAMRQGSLFGWNNVYADPDNYDLEGKFKQTL